MTEASDKKYPGRGSAICILFQVTHRSQLIVVVRLVDCRAGQLSGNHVFPNHLELTGTECIHFFTAETPNEQFQAPLNDADLGGWVSFFVGEVSLCILNINHRKSSDGNVVSHGGQLFEGMTGNPLIAFLVRLWACSLTRIVVFAIDPDSCMSGRLVKCILRQLASRCGDLNTSVETGINSFHAALPLSAGYLKARYSKEKEKSGRHDLNVRLPAPKAGALAKLSYAPMCSGSL